MKKRTRTRVYTWIAISLVALVLAPVDISAEEPWQWSGVSRVVAVGDVHGAYENLLHVLRNAAIINEHDDWIGGNAHLVQNGDIVDRGPHSKKAMDFLMDLEKQAEKAGGRVHVLIGNHEAMNVVGILDLVSKEEFEAFMDRDSRRRRERTFDRYYDDLRASAKENGEEAPSKSDEWDAFQEKYPLGYVEHRQAFAPDGKYGKWILSHNVAIKINDVIFSHGDFSEKFSAIPIPEINERIRAELSGESPLTEGLSFDAESPLQYRGLAHTALTKVAQSAVEPAVERILANLGAKRMVVGHTLTSGVVESRYGGRHLSIDTGMLELYRGGHRIALEIEGDTLRAIHDGGKVDIPEVMDESTLPAYIRAVAAVDPENVDVQLKLVEMHQEANETEAAVALLEKLLERPELVPFRYRDYIGAYYQARGQDDDARTQYLAYIDGLKTLVAQNPENVNIANLLARFCVEKGLELDLAEETIDRALERSPGNKGFLLTRARVLLAKEQYQSALGLLREIPGGEGFDYERLYLQGMAYLGLEDEASAKTAFERATQAEPSREEAKEELRKLEGSGPPVH